MTFTEQEKKILDDALYELLYNVKKEEEKLDKIDNEELKKFKIYEYNKIDVINLIRKIL